MQIINYDYRFIAKKSYLINSASKTRDFSIHELNYREIHGKTKQKLKSDFTWKYFKGVSTLRTAADNRSLQVNWSFIIFCHDQLITDLRLMFAKLGRAIAVLWVNARLRLTDLFKEFNYSTWIRVTRFYASIRHGLFYFDGRLFCIWCEWSFALRGKIMWGKVGVQKFIFLHFCHLRFNFQHLRVHKDTDDTY